MSKIVQAVNAMVATPDRIAKVVKVGDEYFFLYDKYRWSIRRHDDGSIGLWYYPGGQGLDELAARSSDDEWQDVDMVYYVDTRIGTKEARASFAELYTVVTERLHNINTVLDDRSEERRVGKECRSRWSANDE